MNKATRIALAQIDVKTQLNEGLTPLAIAPGTPAGSYQLSAFESINLYDSSEESVGEFRLGQFAK